MKDPIDGVGSRGSQSTDRIGIGGVIVTGSDRAAYGTGARAAASEAWRSVDHCDGLHAALMVAGRVNCVQ